MYQKQQSTRVARLQEHTYPSAEFQTLDVSLVNSTYFQIKLHNLQIEQNYHSLIHYPPPLFTPTHCHAQSITQSLNAIYSPFPSLIILIHSLTHHTYLCCFFEYNTECIQHPLYLPLYFFYSFCCCCCFHTELSLHHAQIFFLIRIVRMGCHLY